MRLSTIVTYALAMFVATAAVRADELDDEIAQAKQKFCGGKYTERYRLLLLL